MAHARFFYLEDVSAKGDPHEESTHVAGERDVRICEGSTTGHNVKSMTVGQQ